MSVFIRKASLSDVPALLDMSIQARIFHNHLLDNYFADMDVQVEKDFLEKSVADKDKIFLWRKKTMSSSACSFVFLKPCHI